MKDVVEALKPYTKAVLGGLLAGLTAYQTAVSDGNVVGNEVVGIAIATLTGLGVVYAVPNKQKG